MTESVLNRMRLEDQSKTIQEKNRQLQAIFDNVSDGLYIEDYSVLPPKILMNKSSKAFFNSIGIPPDNPGLIKNFKYFNKDGEEIPYEKLPIQRIKRGENYEQDIYTMKYGNRELHLNMSGTPIYDTYGKLKMALLCCQIVTENVNQERELKHQRDLYYKLFDILGLPIIYLEYPSLEIRGLNKKARSIIAAMASNSQPDVKTEKIDLNLLNDYFILKLISEQKIDKEDFLNHIAEMKRKKDIVFYYLEIHETGKRSVYKLVLQPLTNMNGEIDEIIITGIDITYEIDQRDTLEKISRMKDELVYTVTHEFKTPLAVISSAVQAMEHMCRDEMSDKVKEYLKKIKQNAFRQLRLVNNLLDVNRISVGKIKLNLANLDIVGITGDIMESVRIYAQHKGIDLVFTSSVKARIMGLDVEKYERILLNLLSNAIKFTPRGKSVYVRIFFKKKKNRLNACVEVEDEGVGIPQDKLEVIFQRFGQVDSSLTRNTEGSGLGLSLVKQIVEALDGEISVQSKPGVGSKFTIFLPARKINGNEPNNPVQTGVRNHHVKATEIELSDINL